MSDFDEKLSAISGQLKNGVNPPTESVRTFLGWFGAERRGWKVVNLIRSALSQYGLATEPDFEGAYYYGQVKFVKSSADGASSVVEPTARLAELEAANRPPITISPDETLQKAASTMLAKDYSQLPVLTGPRDIKGIISWKSIGSRMALGSDGANVRDFMDPARVIPHDAPLFDAIRLVATDDCAIVQARDKTICGIVTATDFNEQFMLLAEPFLLVGEIERGVRNLLHGKFSLKELEEARASGDERQIKGVFDLTFGEYVHLLQGDQAWAKLGVAVDRSTFCAGLERVREIRNDVMHFSPEGIEPAELAALREFAEYLRRLRRLGAA